MYFRLEWCERNPFAVYTDEAVVLVLGDDAVPKDLAVPYSGHFKQLIGFGCKHHLNCFKAADVAVDAEKVHEAVVGESW